MMMVSENFYRIIRESIPFGGLDEEGLAVCSLFLFFLFSSPYSTTEKSLSFLFFFSSHSCSICKFLGQGLNPGHSSNPNCSSDNSGSLTHCSTGELPSFILIPFSHCNETYRNKLIKTVWIRSSIS